MQCFESERFFIKFKEKKREFFFFSSRKSLARASPEKICIGCIKKSVLHYVSMQRILYSIYINIYKDVFAMHKLGRHHRCVGYTT